MGSKSAFETLIFVVKIFAHHFTQCHAVYKLLRMMQVWKLPKHAGRGPEQKYDLEWLKYMMSLPIPKSTGNRGGRGGGGQGMGERERERE